MAEENKMKTTRKKITKKKPNEDIRLKKKAGADTELINIANDVKKHTSGDKVGKLLTEIQIARNEFYRIYMTEMETLATSFLKYKTRPMNKATAIFGPHDAISKSYEKIWGKSKTPKVYKTTEDFLAVYVKTLKRICIDNYRSDRTRESHIPYSLSKKEVYDLANSFIDERPTSGEAWLLIEAALGNYAKEKPIKAFAFRLKYVPVHLTSAQVVEELKHFTEKHGAEPVNLDKVKRWLNKKKPGPVLRDMKEHILKLGYEN